MSLGLSDQGSELHFLRNLKQLRHAYFSSYLVVPTKELLALTLFVSEVVADNHDATLTTNNFALIANLLHARLYLHVLTSFFPLLVPINDATSSEVIRTQLHNHTIGREDTDVVLPHFPADVREDSVPVR
jgi:hypothetical protein